MLGKVAANEWRIPLMLDFDVRFISSHWIVLGISSTRCMVMKNLTS